MSLDKSTEERNKYLLIFIPVLFASFLLEIIALQILGTIPLYLTLIKIGLLGYYMSTSFSMKFKNSTRFYLLLILVNVSFLIYNFMSSSDLFLRLFDSSSFSTLYGGNVLIKMLGALLVFFVLVFSFPTPKKAHIAKGEESAVIDLGKSDSSLKWSYIAIPAGLLMGLIGAFLVFLDSTTFPDFNNLGGIISSLPIVIVLSMMNSLAEGVMYRSAFVASLRDSISKKQILIVASIFYGISQFLEMPGGFFGVVFELITGWFMTKSMYETEGFTNAWKMHFIKDFIIFSSLFAVTFL